MNKLVKKNSLMLAFLLLTQAVFIQAGFAADKNNQSESNIENFSYPSHNCKNKPARPEKPKVFSPGEDVEKYNNEISKYNISVSNYNNAIEQYKSCINQYIKNGNNDISTIRQQLNSALKEARSR
jgi:hypothetical protein